MERLCKEDRKDLAWAMRKSLLEQISTGVLTESADASARNFIYNEATYEQLLNLCFNESREEKYLPASLLEQVAVKVYERYISEEAEKEEKAEKEVEKEAEKEVVKDKEEAVKDKKEVTEGADTVAKKSIFKKVYGAGKKAVAGAGKGVTVASKKVVHVVKNPKVAIPLGVGAAAGGTAAYLYKKAKKKATA